MSTGVQIDQEAFLCGICMFSFCNCRFPPGLSFLPHSKRMQIRLTGFPKLPKGVNGSVKSCPLMHWCPVQGVPLYEPKLKL